MVYNFRCNVQTDEEGRINRTALSMAITYLISLRGTCQRAKVGAVILQNNRIVSTGYNGPLAQGNCKERGCDTEKPCKDSVHAEANAIAAAAKAGIALEGSVMFCSYSPCMFCANLIIQAGITEFIYTNEYRDTEPLNVLVRAGIEIKQYGES